MGCQDSLREKRGGIGWAQQSARETAGGALRDDELARRR